MTGAGVEFRFMRVAMSRLDRIEQARGNLADRVRDEPASVAQPQVRLSRLSASAKRERARFEVLVLGRDPADIEDAKYLAPDVALAAGLRAEWSHKANGTAQTHDFASRTHQGALAQLFQNGSIDAEQLACAVEIAEISSWITAGLEMRTSNLDEPVDRVGRKPVAVEGIMRTRFHIAYAEWRRSIPSPRQAVLDMIIGDAVGFTVAARRYRMHHRRAKRLLLDALDMWPACVDRAFDDVDEESFNDVLRQLA